MRVIQLIVPGRKEITLNHLVLDFNGTLACDGHLLSGIKDRLVLLAEKLQIHVVTADTFGLVREAMDGVPCTIAILPPGLQAEAKLSYVQALGIESCACIGNGYNDRLMVQAAAIGIAVVQGEGAATATMCAADVVTTNILDAMGLLAIPLRIVATLRE